MCNICKTLGKNSIYWGKSHRTWWDRNSDHIQALRDSNTKYATVKHMMNHHPDEAPDFSFKLDKSHRSSLHRQLSEAIKIDETPVDELMNSKSEFGSNSVPRVTIEDEHSKVNNTSFKRFQTDRFQPVVNSKKRKMIEISKVNEQLASTSDSKTVMNTPTFSHYILKLCIGIFQCVSRIRILFSKLICVIL